MSRRSEAMGPEPATGARDPAARPTTGGLAGGERRFIDTFATINARWDMPLAAGRVYAYLLLREGPVGLDRIAADLEISKAGAWSAARHLEQVGQVRRLGERGSKRALFTPAEDFDAAVLKFGALLSSVGKLMSDAASRLAHGKAAARLAERGAFYMTMQAAIAATAHTLAEQRAARADAATIDPS